MSLFGFNGESGREVSYLEATPPDVALLCLIRTDAYVVPIRHVLRNARFSRCVKVEGFNR